MRPARVDPVLHAGSRRAEPERELANLARKSVKEIVTKKVDKMVIDMSNVDTFAGVKKYRFGETEAEDMVGVVTGLAWTEVGGEIPYDRVGVLPGKGNVKSTGKLRRRDAGKCVGGVELRAQPVAAVRHSAAVLREA